MATDGVRGQLVVEVEERATRLLERDPPRGVDSLVSAALADVYRDLTARAADRAAAGGGPQGAGDSGLLGELLGAGPASRPVDVLGAAHQRVLGLAPTVAGARVRLAPGGHGRRTAGAFFTPHALAEHLLDLTLEPVLDEAQDPGSVSVCDPACGAGVFLVGALRRLVRRGIPVEHAVSQLHGADLDPAAVELSRLCLTLECLMLESDVPVGAELRCTDPLTDDAWPSAEHDVVVGNPPFLNRLETLTAVRRDAADALAARSSGTLRAYTDISAVFLQRSVEWVRPGGRIGLVQPQSLLGSRDAGPVREYLVQTCALEALWASELPLFDAHVLTCAPVLRRGARQGPVRRHQGPLFEEVPAVEHPRLDRTWSTLLAGSLGVPEVRLGEEHGVVGDIADCTADFRDQYYGLAPYVHEAGSAPSPNVAPLVTSGLIDPAELRWGASVTRFLKKRWTAPVVDLDALKRDAPLDRWAGQRLVPKVLVGTQGRVIEAVADEDGCWLPSVPTISVVPRGEHTVWHLLAVLLAPPVAAHAAATYAGTALSMRAIKLSARQVAGLPLPAGRPAWDRAADVARLAQQDVPRRVEHLATLARLMCEAYQDEAALEWWLARVRA